MTRLMMRESTALEVKSIEETLSVAIPSPSSVVTINKDGSPLSIFSDDIWDYSATSRTLKTINFRNKIQKIISFEELDHISDFTLDKAVDIYQDSPEWLAQNMRSTRNFIRKWGHFVMHDPLLVPIVPPKYNVEIKITNCKPQLLAELEPWCDNIVVDLPVEAVNNYIKDEQQNTVIPLIEKINIIKDADITIEIDGNTFSNEEYNIIQQFSRIIESQGAVGVFNLGNLKVTINKLQTHTDKLIKL